MAIARALATEPRLLLLDEPFAGLDVTVAMALRIELARTCATYDGVTMLVTHDAIDALTLADHVVVLDEGRVAQRGRPEDVAAQPAHRPRRPARGAQRAPRRATTFTARSVPATSPSACGGPRARRASRGRARRPARSSTATPYACSSTPTPPLLADVTPQAATELGLAPGREVWLSVKATAVSRYGDVVAGR